MPSARTFFLVLLAGCEPSQVSIRVEKPWADDAPGVAIALGADGAVLPPTPAVIAPGARLDVEVADVAFDLHLSAYDPRDAAGLAACGARLGGPQLALAAPLGTWKSRFDPGSGPEALAPSVAPGVDLRYDRCDPPTPCASIIQDYRVLPLVGLNVFHVEWMPGDRWLVVAALPNPTAARPSRVGILSDAGAFDELGTLPTRVLGVASNGAGRVYLSLADGRLFAVDAEGMPALIELSPPGLGGHLAARPDGLVVLHPEGGPATILRQPPGGALVEGDFPPVIDRLEMASPTEMAVLSGPKVLVFEPATAAWIERRTLPTIDPETQLVFSAGALAVLGKTFAFLYEAGEWRGLPSATDVTLLTSATHFDGGVLVFGGVGGAAYWKGGAWCPLTTPGVFSAFRAASTSPDGKRAASGSDPDSNEGSPKVLVWR